MLDDFVPIVHDLEGRTVRVYPIADTHIGALEADITGLEGFLKRIAGEPDSYLMLVGDLLNNGLRSSTCPTDVYSETMPPSAQVEFASELLSPVADKILAAVGGNHEHRTKRDADIDIMHQVMTLIRKPELYRPNMAFVRVNLRRGNTRDHYGIMLTHGKTQARKKKFGAIVEGVDAQIFAHTHTPDASIPARIRFGQNNRITIHNVVTLTACSWLNPGSYSLRGLYEPQAVARPQALVLEFTGSNARKGRVNVEW